MQSAYHFELMDAFWQAMAGYGVAGIEEASRRTQDKVCLRGLNASPPHWWVLSECHDEVSLELPSASMAALLFHHYRESGGLPFRFGPHDSFGRGIAGTTYTLLRGDVRRILLLWKLQLTLGGTPLFYMGAELGLPNDLSYLAHPEQAADSRFVKRIALALTGPIESSETRPRPRATCTTSSHAGCVGAAGTPALPDHRSSSPPVRRMSLGLRRAVALRGCCWSPTAPSVESP